MKSDFKSPNCNKKGAEPTTLFAFYANNGDHEFHSQMISCQTKEFEIPDAATKSHMEQIAYTNIVKDGASDQFEVEAHSVKLGIQGTKNAAKDLVKHKMASSCAPDYNLNKITSYNRFTCHYLGTGVDENGREVRNPFQKWSGTLPSCEDSIQISDELEADVRKLAYDAAGGDEAKLDVNQFLCTIQSIPH